MLLLITRTAVENPEQCLLVEARDLVLDGLDVVDLVAVGQPELRDCWLRRGVTEW